MAFGKGAKQYMMLFIKPNPKALHFRPVRGIFNNQGEAMKTFVCAVLFALTASTALAMDNQKTVCTKGDQERIIEVVYTGEGPVPCEVRYTKNSYTQVLWSAQNLEGYCEDKATAFIAKQRAWGWACETAIEFVLESNE